MGSPLPAGFKESLGIHNGQDDPTRCCSFTNQGILLSTAEIGERWRMANEIDREIRELPAIGSLARPDSFAWLKRTLGLAHVQERKGSTDQDQRPWWKSTCIPFCDCDGDMLCIDTDESQGLRSGEIVAHVHDDGMYRGVAASYADWLERIGQQLEEGRFRVGEDGLLWLEQDYPAE